ncbi:MAG: gliding motility-associated C-terminal domain-containing protein [Bacteroidia bacterium]|nr:gliding motility-associated C-terminal domain-containing protein [Bacteroidia bacterium]
MVVLIVFLMMGGATYQTAGTLTFSLPVGTNYSIIVKDGRGCISSTSNISIPSVLNVDANVTSNYNGSSVSCNGATNGSASTSVTGGIAPYSYNWNTTPVQTTATASNIGAGTYTVTVTDGNGCTRTDVVTLTQPTVLTSSAAVTSNYNGQNISCNGANNGTAAIAHVGGTAPYTYSWNTTPSQPSAIAIGLGASSYTATVTDANGCTSTSTVSLTQPAALATTTSIISNYNGQNISCNGANDGSALATVTGGTTPYSYSWSTSPAQSTSTASSLGEATYTVSISDVNGCTSSATVALTQPAVLTSTAIAASNYNGFNISCHGLSDGAIDMTTAGGTSPYQFSWNNGGTTEDISGVVAGTYNAIVTDVNGCTSTASVTLIQADSVLATINVLSNYNGFGVSCFNNADGTIDINVSGGTSTYTYLWSNNDTTQDVTGLIAGAYLVTVTDANNCSDTMTTVLTQPTAMNIVVDSISNYNGFNVSCFNSSNGSISLTTSGGVGPYNFLWNNNAITEDIDSIPYGGYLVTVTDANNCVLLFDTTLTQPTELVALATTTSVYGDYDVSCYGSTNGTVDLNVTGGLTPYVYTWSTTASTEDLAGLGAGVYSVNVVDLNGCSDSASTVVVQPDSLVANINSVSNFNSFSISCNGASNGSIDAGVNGGMAPYDYLWSNGATTQDLLLLGAGNYTLIVIDSNSCVDSISVTLTEPAPVVVVIDSISNYNGYGVSCNLSTNGSVYASVSGGTSSYTYLWNTGATTEDITGLGADSYILNVEDSNGCVASADTTLIEPAAFVDSYTFINPGCNGLSNGSIDFSLAGGVIPYTYSWNTGATSEDLNNIPIGTYTLVYADLNGCSDSISVTLIEPLVLSNNIAHQDVLCYGGNNAMIDINIIGGTLPYSYLWSNGATTEDVDSLTQGMYYVTITDGQGCSRTDTVTISQPDSLALDLVSPVLANGHNISFYQGADGSIDLTVAGGVQPYNYIWSNGATTEDVENISAGQYYVVVTDQHGCVASRQIILTEPFDLAMPTGITPNDDGRNDFFVVKGIEAYPDNVLTIYNRWGNIVYKRENYLNQWNGTNTSGEELPDGTYYAVLEINGRDITLNGYVEIRRK